MNFSTPAPNADVQDALAALSRALQERQLLQLEALCTLVERAVALSSASLARVHTLTERVRSLRTPGASNADELVELDPMFATATMAELLLTQGRPAAAARIFRALLAQEPTDAAALEGLARCGPDAGLAPEPDGMLDRAAPPEGYDDAVLRCLPVDPVTAVIFWELPAALLPPEAHTQLALELTTDDGGQTLLEPEVRLVKDLPLRGEYFARGLAPGATHQVRLGLYANGEFRAVMQTRPVSTPRGEPAPAFALGMFAAGHAAGAPQGDEGGARATGTLRTARAQRAGSFAHDDDVLTVGPSGTVLASALAARWKPRDSSSSWTHLRAPGSASWPRRDD